MALRNQPYLPLYIQDFITDEKLSECSAAATGVYIRIMCLMHKSDTYGKILLKQKYKQKNNFASSFACMLFKNLPYDLLVVESALIELIEENVLHIEGDYLVQKRMVKDNAISELRSKVGKKGGVKTQKKIVDFASTFAKAKTQANTENAIEYENENINEDENAKKNGTQNGNFLVPEMMKYWKSFFKNYPEQKKTDYTALLSIAQFLAEKEKIDCDIGIMPVFKQLTEHISSHDFYKSYSLLQVSRNIQSIVINIINGPKNGKIDNKTRRKQVNEELIKRYPQ